jgi:hypothetical protein
MVDWSGHSYFVGLRNSIAVCVILSGQIRGLCVSFESIEAAVVRIRAKHESSNYGPCPLTEAANHWTLA